MANAELFQAYTPKDVDALMPLRVGEGNIWHAFDIEPMVMVYNTEMISAENAPTKWEDMLDEQYKGQIACADPTTSSSSYGVIMGIVNAYGTDGGGYEFVERLVQALDGKILSSSSAVYKGVADGEYMIGMTYEEAALRYIDAGEPIAIVYPEGGHLLRALAGGHRRQLPEPRQRPASSWTSCLARKCSPSWRASTAAPPARTSPWRRT